MTAIGMGVAWAGYGLALFGWCLLQGYDVTLGQLMSPLHPYGAGAGQPWPPKSIPATQVFPGKQAAAAAPAA